MVTEKVSHNERTVSLTIPTLFPRIRNLINDSVINDKAMQQGTEILIFDFRIVSKILYMGPRNFVFMLPLEV